MSAKPFPLPPLTDDQKKRSASSTIAGYLYQFERSVVEVLQLKEDEPLRVEGIEDIDIWSDNPRIVQVKYYAAQKWSLSSVRNAVHELLKSFADEQGVQYVLYVHFGFGEVPPKRLDLSELKKCLTYKPRNKPVQYLYSNYDDSVLADFAKSFQIISGDSLEEQRKTTTSAIAKALDCGEDEAEALHRMRAVQFLHEIAVNKDEKDRVITRGRLLSRLKDQTIYYSRWHKREIGRERFIKAAIKRLKDASLNQSNLVRGVLLKITGENLCDVCNLASVLADDMDGEVKKRTTAARPWTLILEGDEGLIREVKISLLDKGLAFNDGFETVKFTAAMFDTPAFVKSKQGTDRLSRASHRIRLVSETSMRGCLDAFHKLDRLVTLVSPDSWICSLSDDQPIQMHEIEVEDLTNIVRKVIS
ncbi:hypothetical protein [Corynebacterium variabile]|uniref:hypothetical protein n=1 Tax=Corynebacterium variabile TaxID=1727 RepID=UPI0028D756BE|nr:hypothetical protein [Corynebacterium variabile]